MRGRSSASMPMPLSRTVMRTSRRRSRRRSRRGRHSGVYFTALSTRLLSRSCSRLRSAVIWPAGSMVGGDRDVLFLRDVVVEIHQQVDDRLEREGLQVELERAGLDLGDVHDGAEHGVEPLGFLDRVGERLLDLRGIFLLQRELRAGLQAGQRRAQIVRDVVERLAHGADQRLVALQHAVEERDQLVDLVLGARIGHAPRTCCRSG